MAQCALRQILKKTQEQQIDTHQLFADFKSAFDTPDRDHLYATMSDVIPNPSIRLMMLTSLAEVTAKFSEEARNIGLAVNESKIKYISSTTTKDIIGESVEIDGYNF